MGCLVCNEQCQSDVFQNLKKCNKCGEVKPLFEFNRRAKSKDLHHNTCRKCANEIARGYYWRNRDRIIAYFKKYHLKQNAWNESKYVFMSQKEGVQRKGCPACRGWVFIMPEDVTVECCKCKKELKVIRKGREGKKGIILRIRE